VKSKKVEQLTDGLGPLYKRHFWVSPFVNAELSHAGKSHVRALDTNVPKLWKIKLFDLWRRESRSIQRY
jgi:hypothetical protein